MILRATTIFSRNCPENRFRSCFIAAALLLCLAAGLYAAGPEPDDFAFAEWLYGSGDYFRAVSAYKRYLFLQPGADRAAEAQFKIADCYRRGKKIQEALDGLALVREKYPDSPVALKAEFLTGLIWYDAGDNKSAAEAFDSLRAKAPDLIYAEQGEFLKGFTALKKWEWKEANSDFGAFAEAYPASRFTETALKLREKTADLDRRLPHKSPLAAGVMSAVLPGAGQLYSERVTDALSSLFWNLLLGYLTYNSYDSEIRREPDDSKRSFGPAYTVGGIFGLFYLSNIYGAVNCARNANFLIKVNFTYSAISDSGASLGLIMEQQF